MKQYLATNVIFLHVSIPALKGKVEVCVSFQGAMVHSEEEP